MLYIYLDAKNIKLLHLKKSLLGQYETAFTKKSLQVTILQDGKPANSDVIASAVKEILETLASAPVKEKEVTLILPQKSFSFLRTEMPADISSSALPSFIIEKARTELQIDPDLFYCDFLVRESEGQKQILFFAIKKDLVELFTQSLTLLDLKVVSVIPEALTYFKLFEKTLRQNKKENIWYVSYDTGRLSGYVYDSCGLLEQEGWDYGLTKKDKVEEVLQKKATTYTAKYTKLNRLILSGSEADTVRQDTFTKNVGVWTNPLKRIITHFYADYLKLLGDQEANPLPIVDYDMLIGAFILGQEEKSFSLMKGGSSNNKISTSSTMPSMPMKKIPAKGIAFFLISFGLTFVILFGLAQVPWNNLGIKMPAFAMPSFSLPSFAKATPTPTVAPTSAPSKPTATPTPTIDRKEVKVKVLNGSGISGKATVVKDFLRDAGYEEILTGNADAFDYDVTVVQIKADKKELRGLIEKDISSQVEKPTFETLDEEDAADVVIIVGTDFK